MSSWPRWLAAVLLAWWSIAAHGHASLIGADPPNGAMLNAAPAGLVLHFNEPVSPIVFKLMQPGVPMPGAVTATSIGDDVRVTLPTSPSAGAYALSWRIVSADGHPVGGLITFSVGTEPAADGTTLPATALDIEGHASASRWVAIGVVRWVLYLALFAGVGWAVLRGFGVWREPLARVARAQAGGSIALGIVLVPLALGLQGLDALNAPWPALFERATWRAGAATSYAATCVLLLLALAAAIWASRSRSASTTASTTAFTSASTSASTSAFKSASSFASTSAPSTACAAALSLLALGSAFAASGHAGTAPPRWLARPMVLAHVVGVALWIGSLAPLAMSLRPGRSDAVLAVVSRILPWALTMMLASGAVLVVLQLTDPSQLLSTGYGRLLLAKLLLVAVMLLLGAFNRWVLTSRARSGDAIARRRLRRSVLLEIVLAVVVLALVAGWRFTPPPRSVALIQQTSPVFVHLHSPQAMADLTLTPAAGGRVGATLFVQDSEFRALAAKELSLTLSNPALGIEPFTQPARPVADGAWEVDPFIVPMAGRWHVSVQALITDFEQLRWEGDVDLRF